MLLLSLLACPSPKDPADTADTGAEDTADSGEDSGGDSGEDTAEDSGGDSGEDTGGDTAADSGGDSGGDSGADSGGDSGGDTGPVDTGEPVDTGDTGAACGEADLAWSVEVRDEAGVSGTAFTPSDRLTMAGVVTNPCAADLMFLTGCSDTFLGEMAVADASGGDAIAWSCDGVRTTWTVPAGGSLEQAESWGRLPANDWRVTVEFLTGVSASTAFTVR